MTQLAARVEKRLSARGRARPRSPAPDLRSAGARELLNLQSQAGNRAVTGLVAAIQRQPHDQTGHPGARSPEIVSDQRAVDELLTSLGPLRHRGEQMIRFAHDTGIPGRDVRAAVDAASFDESPINRLQAAHTYVIGRAAGHPAAAAIRSGQVKVHALDTMPTGVLAAYVAIDTPTLTHDTIYVQPTLGVDNLADRSVVVHELQHAEQDGNPTHPVDPGQSPTKARAEWEAYRTQARYVISQLEGVTGRERQRELEQAARSLEISVYWMLILEAQNDRPRLESLIASLFEQAPSPYHLGAQELSEILSLPRATLESRASQAMVAGYESQMLGPEEAAPFDGYTGHTSEDIEFRTGGQGQHASAAEPSP